MGRAADRLFPGVSTDKQRQQPDMSHHQIIPYALLGLMLFVIAAADPWWIEVEKRITEPTFRDVVYDITDFGANDTGKDVRDSISPTTITVPVEGTSRLSFQTSRSKTLDATKARRQPSLSKACLS